MYMSNDVQILCDLYELTFVFNVMVEVPWHVLTVIPAYKNLPK